MIVRLYASSVVKSTHGVKTGKFLPLPLTVTTPVCGRIRKKAAESKAERNAKIICPLPAIRTTRTTRTPTPTRPTRLTTCYDVF